MICAVLFLSSLPNSLCIVCWEIKVRENKLMVNDYFFVFSPTNSNKQLDFFYVEHYSLCRYILPSNYPIRWINRPLPILDQYITQSQSIMTCRERM